MLDWLRTGEAIVVSITAILGALGILWTWFKKLRPHIEAKKAKAALREKREEIVFNEIIRVSEELQPNNGTSLYDIISRMDESLIHNAALVRALINLDPYDPVFETDALGGYTAVNRVWGQYAGITPEQAKGNGWISAVHEKDRDRVWTEWSSAIEQRRDFDMLYRVVNAVTQDISTIHYRAIVSKKPNGDIIGWVGVGQLAPVKDEEDVNSRNNRPGQK